MFTADITAEKFLRTINFGQNLFRVESIAYVGGPRPFRLTVSILADGSPEEYNERFPYLDPEGESRNPLD